MAYADLLLRQAEVVAGLGLPERMADRELDTIVRLAAALSSTPCATVNILDAEQQCQLATHGFEGGPSPRAESLCEQTRRLTEEVFASSDLLTDPRFVTNPWVDGRFGRVRGYLSAPLRVEQVVIGTLCVFDPEPHEFSPEDHRRVADLADVVVALLERDRESRRTAELAAQVARSAAFDRALLDALPVGVLAVDGQGRVQLANQVCRGWELDVRLGARPAAGADGAGTLFAADGATPLQLEDLPSSRALREGAVRDLEVVVADASGSRRRLSVTGASIKRPDGGVLGAVLALADVTRQRDLEDQLRSEALHDALTGLPHRALLVDRVQHGLLAAGRTGVPVGVLFCDLDGFKAVNDRWGHAAGDVVLRETAGRLQSVLRPGDTVGRFGGDEFLVVCPELPCAEAAEAVVERIVRAVSAPITVDGGSAGAVQVVVGVSVGAALSRADESPESLLVRADEAMYRIKRAHHGGVGAERPGRERVAGPRRG